MSSNNELTPQQEFDKVLSSAAVDIARMEQVRDAPGRPGSAAPAPPSPPGTPPNPNAGARPPVNKDFQNNAIADRKAEALKKVDKIGNKVSPEAKKEMQDKAYSTLYPKDKNDLNQIPRDKNVRNEKGDRIGDKEVDNAQERANALRGKKSDKDKGKDPDKKADTELDKSQDRAEALRSKDKSKDETAQKKDAKPQTDKPGKDQPSEGDKTQRKAVQNPSQDKVGSMSTRFSQSLSHNQPSSSPAKSSPGKSSPSPSAPGGSSGGGSRGSGSSPGGRGD